MFYTERLMLRTIEPEVDANFWIQWMNDIEYLGAVLLQPPVPSAKADGKKFLEKIASRPGQPFFVVCEKPSRDDAPEQLGAHEDVFVKDSKPRYAPIGVLSISSPNQTDWNPRIARLGIAFDRAHQNRGHGTELLLWAMQYCFKTLGLHKIELDVDSHNTRAVHVYEKTGFVREGVRRKRLWYQGEWRDLIEMGILEEEWFARQKP